MRLLSLSICLLHWSETCGGPVIGRSVSALKDICDRFPWIASCQAKDAASFTVPPQPPLPPQPPQQAVVTENPIADRRFIPENQSPEPQWRPGQDYCKKYSSNFDTYCDGRSKDGVITNFCHTYQKKCLQYEDPGVVTTPKSTQPVMPTIDEIKHYCSVYKRDYANLCVNRQVPSSAETFCQGYSNICPGSPDPGSMYPTNSVGTRKKPPRPNNQQSNPYTSDGPSSTDPFGGFPMDGNIGGMLGIPTGGGGPAEGLGGMNNMEVPNFGGPVEGGLGFGRSVFAPFFGANKGFNVVPTKSFTQGEKYNFAGMSAGGTSGVDWSGTPGLNMVNRALGLGGSSPASGGGLPGFGKKK